MPRKGLEPSLPSLKARLPIPLADRGKLGGDGGDRTLAGGSTGRCLNHLATPPNSMDLAGMTGLEPATPGVTGQRSNQLSYIPEPGLWETPARLRR